MPDFTGTNANNIITATGTADTVSALAGSDTVSALGGDDVISGGEGADVLNGGAGNDVIYGFGASDAITGSGDIKLDIAGSGFTSAIYASSAPGDPGRMFVVERGGVIKLLDLATGLTSATPVLDIASTITAGGEQGLLGMAFHPDYQANGRFFVYVTNTNGDIEVRSYTRSAGSPDVADPASGDVILAIPHPVNGNHNAGWMSFGPDGYLYISVGDGGGGGDALNNAQNKNVLLGKMLRIDVDGDDFAGDATRDYAIPDDNPFVGAAGAGEIWAFGLRNPWRSSFDRLTGDLYIGDVGQNAREEINFQPHDSAGGENYGWKVKEGTLVYDDTVPGNPPASSPDLVDPIIDYPHSPAPDGGFAVTGGYVYRGTGPGMQGAYFYADYSTKQFWSLRVVDGEVVDAINRTEQLVRVLPSAQLAGIPSFAEDGNGNLYVLNFNGRFYRITPQVGAGDGADVMHGGLGDDTMRGGAGADRMNGGAGTDTVFGGIQADVVFGGDGDDELFGNSGGDRLRGGAGVDLVNGGAGADNFIFRLGDGADTIADFEDNQDTIRIHRDTGVNSVSQALALAIEVGADVVFTFAGGEVLTVLGASKAALADDLLV